MHENLNVDLCCMKLNLKMFMEYEKKFYPGKYLLPIKSCLWVLEVAECSISELLENFIKH